MADSKERENKRGDRGPSTFVRALTFALGFVRPGGRNRRPLAVDSQNEVAEQGEGPSLTRQAFVILIAKAVAFVFATLAPLLLVRRMSQQDFGLYKQAFLVITTAINVLPLGFHMTAYYFLPRTTGADRKAQIVFNILLFHLVVAGLVTVAIVAFPQLLGAVFNSDQMTEFAPLVALAIFTLVLSSFLEAIALAHREVQLATVFIVGSNFTKSLFLVTAAVLLSSVRSLLYAVIAHGVVQIVVMLVYLHSRFPAFWRAFEWSQMRAQLTYGLPFSMNSIFTRFSRDIPDYFVSNRFGAANYAIFAVGCSGIPFLGMVVESVNSITLSRFSHLQATNQRREILELAARISRKMSAIILPVVALLMVTANEFITILYTDQYLGSVPIFMMNLLVTPVFGLTIFVDGVTRAYAKHRYFNVKVRAMEVVTLAAGCWFIMGRFGMMALIVFEVFVRITGRLLLLAKVGSILHFRWSDLALFRDVGKLALAAAASAIAAASLRSVLVGANPILIFLACGVTLVAVYAAAAWFLRVMTPTEQAALVRKVAPLQRRFRRGRAMGRAA